MVLVRLPGHHRDGAGEGDADEDGQHLQQRLQPVREPAPAQTREDQLALLVQVLGLEIDQSLLVAKERVEDRVGLGARTALAHPDRHRRRGTDRAKARLGLAAALRLQHFRHNAAPQPGYGMPSSG